MIQWTDLIWLNLSYALIFVLEIIICGWKSSSIYMLLFPQKAHKRSAAWDGFTLLVETIGYSTLLLNIFVIWHEPFFKFVMSEYGLNLWPGPQTLWIGLGFFVLYDFLNYWFHRFEHRYSFLWNGHQFHHSATFINPITNDRDHPVRRIYHLRRVLFLVFGLYAFNIYVMHFRILMNRLAHSRIDSDYGWFGRYIFVSPRYHHLHHDIHHNGYNFGDVFVIWDHLFGTYKEPTASIHSLEVGMQDNFFETRNPVVAYLKPFADFYVIPSKKIYSVLRPVKKAKLQ